MKEWWLANWRVLLGGGAMFAAPIAGVFSIIVALINRMKPKEKQKEEPPQPKSPSLDHCRGLAFDKYGYENFAALYYEKAIAEYEPTDIDRVLALVSATGAHAHMEVDKVSRNLDQEFESIKCLLEAEAVCMKVIASKNVKGSKKQRKETQKEKEIFAKVLVQVQRGIDSYYLTHPPSPAPLLSISPAYPPGQTPPVSGSPGIADMNNETALCD